jgi:hypothetical protein
MSRSFDRDEPERKEETGESQNALEGLSRSGGENRPRVASEAEEQQGFGPNKRERITFRDREYRVRPSEGVLLTDLGTFRVVREGDLIKGVYRGDATLARADFRSLRQQGLIRSITFQSLRGGASRVHTLTGEGHNLVVSRNGGKPQFFYWGVVKPSEVEHDSLLYRAYLNERHRIQDQGGSVKRVVLDYELKRDHYSRINKPGGGPYRKVQAESAQELHLPVIDGHVVFPDFRVEYENDRGEPARVDVEVATGNYREQHLAVKAAAGFHVYASGGSGGVRVQSGARLQGPSFHQSRSVYSL